MPNIKKPPPKESPNQVAPNPNATKLATNPGKLTPVTTATTGTSGFGFLGWFTTNAEGCTVRFGIEQQVYLTVA